MHPPFDPAVPNYALSVLYNFFTAHNNQHMEWLWTWAAPGNAAVHEPKQGARLLVENVLAKGSSQDRQLKALECLDVLQEGFDNGYDAFFDVLETHACLLLNIILNLPSSTSSPQRLQQYLVALPTALSSPSPPAFISSIQLIVPNEAFQTLAELVEIPAWSSPHLTPLALALLYARRAFEEAEDLQGLLLSAPMVELKTIGPGRSIIGLLGEAWRHLNETYDLDRSQASMARRYLMGVYQVLIGRSACLDALTTRNMIKVYLKMVVLSDKAMIGETLGHIDHSCLWLALDVAVNEIPSLPEYPAPAPRLAAMVRSLLERKTILDTEIPNNAVRSFAYNLCQLLADASLSEIEARVTFSCFESSGRVACSLRSVAAAQGAILIEDGKTLALADVISRIDGSDASLLHNLVQQTRRRWLPIIRALGVEPGLVLEAIPFAAVYETTELDLLFNVAPDLARSLAPPPPPSIFNPQMVSTRHASSASAYAGKVYSQHEFRATRFVPGQPFYPTQFNGQSPSSTARAPSRHVDEF